LYEPAARGTSREQHAARRTGNIKQTEHKYLTCMYKLLQINSSLKRFIPATSKLQVSWVNVVNERSWMEHATKVASELQGGKNWLFG